MALVTTISASSTLQAVARMLVALEIEVQKVASAHAFGEDARVPATLRQHALDLFPHALDLGQVAPLILIPIGVRMPVVSMSMRFLMAWSRRSRRRDAQRIVHLGDELVVEIWSGVMCAHNALVHCGIVVPRRDLAPLGISA